MQERVPPLWAVAAEGGVHKSQHQVCLKARWQGSLLQPALHILL